MTVVVNDRGPFIKGRVLDLSLAAAKVLHMTDRGVIAGDGGGGIAARAQAPRQQRATH